MFTYIIFETRHGRPIAVAKRLIDAYRITKRVKGTDFLLWGEYTGGEE